MSGLLHCHPAPWSNKTKGGGSLFTTLRTKRNCGKHYIIKCKIFKLLHVNILSKCFTCYRKLLRTLKEAERIRSKWWRHHWLHQRSLRTPSGRKQPCCRTWETGTQRVVCYPVFRRRGNCLAYLRVWRCLL